MPQEALVPRATPETLAHWDLVDHADHLASPELREPLEPTALMEPLATPARTVPWVSPDQLVRLAPKELPARMALLEVLDHVAAPVCIE